MINTTVYVDALDANLNELYQEGIEKWPEEYSKVFNVETSDKYSEKDSYISGLSSMPEKPEGVAATYDTPVAGISKTYVNKTYALGYEITEEAIEDNLRTSETFSKLPQALIKSAMETVETTDFNHFNNGFATAGFDGKVLFATDHPMLDGSTQSNRPTTHADLSVTSLTAGLTAMEKFTDDRGLKWPCKPSMLLVPVDLWNVAEEIIGSGYKPYSANNEINAINTAKDLQYFVSHYLTDTDAWFVLAEKDKHFLKHFWRVKLGALRRGSNFDTTNLKHLARMRFSSGWSHWLGTYGTAGA